MSLSSSSLPGKGKLYFDRISIHVCSNGPIITYYSGKNIIHTNEIAAKFMLGDCIEIQGIEGSMNCELKT